MKKFIVINNEKSWIIQREFLAEAVTFAENFCDHSHEVIVREIKELTDFTKD